MKYKFIPFMTVMVFSVPALAAELTCSIHPDTASDLGNLAKISLADAKKIALADVKASNKKVLDGELESEQGCLVYSFDIRVSGKSGLEEIMIDAGTGKIVSHTHESPKKEAAEQAEDAKSIHKPK